MAASSLMERRLGQAGPVQPWDESSDALVVPPAPVRARQAVRPAAALAAMLLIVLVALVSHALWPRGSTSGTDRVAAVNVVPVGPSPVATPTTTRIEAREEASSAQRGVAVEGVVAGPPPEVVISVVLDDLVLGHATARVEPSGAYAALVPIVLPVARGNAEVRLTARDADGPTLGRAPLTVHGGASVQIWRTVVSPGVDGGTTVTLEAFAPAGVTSLRATITSETGSRLGVIEASIAPAGGITQGTRPGGTPEADETAATTAAGEEAEVARALGLSTLVGSVPLSRDPDGPIQIEVRWTNPVDGTSGFVLYTYRGVPASPEPIRN